MLEPASGLLKKEKFILKIALPTIIIITTVGKTINSPITFFIHQLKLFCPGTASKSIIIGEKITYSIILMYELRRIKNILNIENSIVNTIINPNIIPGKNTLKHQIVR